MQLINRNEKDLMNRIHLQNLSVFRKKLVQDKRLKYSWKMRNFSCGISSLEKFRGQLSGIISSSELLASVNLGNEYLCHANTSPLIVVSKRLKIR